MLAKMARKVEVQEHAVPWKLGKCFSEEHGSAVPHAAERSCKVKTDMSIDFGNREVIADGGKRHG